MKLKDVDQLIEKVLDEVPMNPKAYMASLSTAEKMDIMVGFEFEVCVKPAMAKKYHKENKKKETNVNFILTNPIPDNWWQGLSRHDISMLYAKEKNRLKIENESYSDWQDYTKAHIGRYFKPVVDRIYETLSARDKRELKSNLSRRGESTSSDPNLKSYALWVALQDFCGYHKLESANMRSKDWQIMKQIYDGAGFSEGLIKNIFRTLDFKKAVDLFKLTLSDDSLRGPFAEAFLKDYDLADELSDEEYDDDLWDDYNNYSYYKNPVADAVRQGMGVNVEVFNEYHQRRKSWDRWYVEPDGSIEPEGSQDGIAEIVSPPIPASQALEVLDRFYETARAYKFYSNESTGLHINVSLPPKTDILKLALFVGDQHILKTFDREDNEYAMSVMDQLQDMNPTTAPMNPSARTPKAKKFLKKEEHLRSIARMIMGQHCSSISLGPGGKYISFRGVGGDYLKNGKAVKESIGRFIHAMSLAADPTMYRKEYLGKLSKLVQKYSDEPKSIQYSEGVCSLVFVVYDTKGEAEGKILRSMVQWQNHISGRYGPCIFSPMDSIMSISLLKTYGERLPQAKDKNLATAHGFFAVPMTQAGQQKLFQSLGINYDRIKDFNEPRLAIDHPGNYNWEYIPKTNSWQDSSLVKFEGGGWVKRGHAMFGKLVLPVLRSLKDDKK